MTNPIALFIGYTVILLVVAGLLESFGVFDSLRPHLLGMWRMVRRFIVRGLRLFTNKLKVVNESVNLMAFDWKQLRKRIGSQFDKPFRQNVKRFIILLLGGSFFALFLIFIFSELYLRARGPSPSVHRYLYRWHPEAGYALNRNYHYEGQHREVLKQHDYNTDTNSFGFRSREISYRKKGYRILMLGDAFTFGIGVDNDKTISWIIEDLLRATPGYENAEVLNAGTNGSSNVSQVNYFNAEGVGFKPDLVVLNLYTGNDFDQNLEESKGLVQCHRYSFLQAYTGPGDFIARSGWSKKPNAVSGDIPVPTQGTAFWIYVKPSWVQRIDEYLHGNSWAYRNISDRILNLNHVQKYLERIGQIRIEQGSQKKVGVHQTRTVKAGRQYTQQLLQQFNESLRQKGIEFLVHVIPYKNEVRGTLGAFFQDHRDNTEVFLDFMKDQGILHVYDAPVFEKYQYWFDLTYNALYGHYTFDENQVSAAILYRYLAREVLNIEQSDADLAMKKVVTVNLPLTRPEFFFTTNNQLPNLRDFESYKRITIENIDSLTYAIPKSCNYRGGGVSFNKDTFETNLLLPDALRVYIYPGQDWGEDRLDFGLRFTNPVDLVAVVADVPAIYPNYSTTKMVLFDAQTDEPLAGALAPYKSWALAAKGIGVVKNLKISLFRYAGSNTFSVRGFHLFYR